MRKIIAVRGLSFVGRHGVYAAERELGRCFEVDVFVSVDWSTAAKTDDLADTLDYTKICEIVLEVGEKQSYHLIERLTAEIARRIFLFASTAAHIEIELRKLVPELPGKPTHVAVYGSFLASEFA